MTWLHWILFGCLIVLAIATITQPSDTKTKLPAFLTLICMTLLLIVGQPN